MKSFHDFLATTIDGAEIRLSQFAGKKLLVVNTASECGYTPQYATLQELHEEFGGDDFAIVAFPSNDIGGQEPGSSAEIFSFCQRNYGVTFMVMEKVRIIGDEAHPVYQWLTQKSLNGKADVEVAWNFQKFLIDEQGGWVDMVAHTESPACDRIMNWITNN